MISVDYINKSVGVKETPKSIASLLTRMCLKSEVMDDGSNVTVEVPPTRSGKEHLLFSLRYTFLSQIFFIRVMLLKILL